MLTKKNSQLYQEISIAEGSHYIASEYAISKVQELIKVFDCRSVLEVGLGIGSISKLVLWQKRGDPSFVYHGTEANAFCLKKLPENLKVDYERLRIFQNIQQAEKGITYDLIIVDGADTNLALLKNLISKNGIIAIEGDRMPQLKYLREIFPDNSFCHSISITKNPKYSPFSDKAWQNGLKIVFINPNRKQRLWRLKEKILTKLKYLYPDRHQAKPV